jgi:hypothetical protein
LIVSIVTLIVALFTLFYTSTGLFYTSRELEIINDLIHIILSKCIVVKVSMGKAHTIELVYALLFSTAYTTHYTRETTKEQVNSFNYTSVAIESRV